MPEPTSPSASEPTSRPSASEPEPTSPSGPEPTSRPSASEPTGPDATSPARPSPCPATPDAAPLDYTAIEIGGRYFVDVEQRSGEWAPAEHVPMPRHHATRLEWQNPDMIAALGPAATGRLRVTLVVESREIRPVPGRHEWRALVKAKILAICSPGPG